MLMSLTTYSLPACQAHGQSNSRETRVRGAAAIVCDFPLTGISQPGHRRPRAWNSFVLSGEIELGEFTLASGGYAYLPPGTSGFPMRSVSGARILYFVDEANDSAVIQTPLIASSTLLTWQPTANGFSVKELRSDPGSGGRTWLLKIEPGATKAWQRSTQTQGGLPPHRYDNRNRM